MSTVVTARARGRVGAPPGQVFHRLRDLDAHRDLAAPHIEILELYGPRGARRGGSVRLNGPLGLRRAARTRVRGAEFPHRLTGTADAGGGTCATLSWSLGPDAAGTGVEVTLEVAPGTVGDRLLLMAGGRTWLRRRLRIAIRRLAADCRDSTSIGPMSSATRFAAWAGRPPGPRGCTLRRPPNRRSR